jgi:hypothetical protein
MAIPIVLTVGPLAAAVANWFAVSATPTSGTALTLAHTSVLTPRRVELAYGNEASARTLRLTGTNADGNTIQETLAVPSGGAGTVYSSQDFLTLTEAMPLGSGWTAAMTLGTNGIASSPWKLLNAQHQAYPSISWGGIVIGTVTWGIEYTYDNPNNNQNTMGGALGNYPTPPTPWTFAGLTGKNANADGSSNNPFQAWRVILSAGTGSVTVTGLEGGMTESGGV